MAITTRDQFFNALANNSTRYLIDKASLANTAVGQTHSLWRATGQPGQGAIPSTAAVCNSSTLGGINFAQQTSPATSYIGILEAMASQAGTTLEIHDRLMHMGGLSGTSTTAQTVNVDISAVLATDNMANRIGDSNYSDINWFLEWYTDTGSTSVSAIVNVTYNDGTSGNLTTTGLLGATRRASFMFGLNNLIPAADSGKFIRDVNTVQLNATSGTVGSFGVTATRYRGAIFLPVSNSRLTAKWDDLGIPEAYNGSCLFPIVQANSTTTGIVRATGKIAHG